MADKGQSSDPAQPNYHPEGIPLIEGLIELVDEKDPLVGSDLEHLNKVKLYTWRGHSFISDPQTDVAGVGWILAENWFPYQRPTFVTPPFAGYISGHSTFSSAAAEVLTHVTGSEYFPGGMGEFLAEKNEFLVFEDGPSVDVRLQWARYKDASDESSLSRIWGGIHPPVDDIPGRLIGKEVGKYAFEYAKLFFTGALISKIEGTDNKKDGEPILYPNPVNSDKILHIYDPGRTHQYYRIKIYDLNGKLILTEDILPRSNHWKVSLPTLASGLYNLLLLGNDHVKTIRFIIN